MSRPSLFARIAIEFRPRQTNVSRRCRPTAAGLQALPMVRLLPQLAAAILSAFLPTQASAQTTFDWDPSQTNVNGGSDGGGVWDTATGNWYTSSGDNSLWANVASTSANNAVFGFGGTGGTVTFGAVIDVGTMMFNSFSGTYTLDPTTSDTLTIYNGITMNSGAGAVTISATGAGVALGAANTWTNNSSSLLTVSSNITNGSNTLTVAGTGSTTISGAIGSGTGGVTMNGAGTLTLSGANTFTGTTTVNNGTLSLTGSIAGAANSPLVVGGGTFSYAPSGTGNTQTMGGLTINAGGSTINASSNNTLALGAIPRNTGGVVYFNSTFSGTITETTALTNQLLGTTGGGWALYGAYTSTTNEATGSPSLSYATSTTSSPYQLSGLTYATSPTSTQGQLESTGSSTWDGIPSGGSGTINYELNAALTAGTTQGSARNVNTILYTGNAVVGDFRGGAVAYAVGSVYRASSM